MGSIRARHRKLWIRFMDADGERQERPTPFLVNRDEALAQQLLEDTEANVADQIRAKARAGGGPLTLRAYGRAWSQRRILKSETGDRHASATDEDKALENYVYGTRLDDGVPLGDLLVKDVRTPHIRQLVEKLEQRDSRKGGKLAPRTVCNAHGILHTLFEHARADQLVMTNPCDLPVGVLPERDDKDPSWRSTAIFSRGEVETLISDPAIPLDRRAINGVLFIAGTRWGEMAAFQWRDYDPTMEPLGRLDLNKSYSPRLKRVKSTKTGKQRLIPVHPTLAKLLAEWKLSGWPAMFGRAPGPDDLIFPNAPVLLHSSGAPLAPAIQAAEFERVRTLSPTARERYRLPQLGLKRFHGDCEEVGLRLRRNHDARRTTNSLLIADGARDPVRGFIVWGPGKKVSDVYTTLPWETFCEEMAKLKIALREPQVFELRAVNAPSPFHPPALTAPPVNTPVDRSAQALETSSSRGTGSGTGGGTSENHSENSVGRTGFGPVLDVCLDADDIRSAVENAKHSEVVDDGAAAGPCATDSQEEGGMSLAGGHMTSLAYKSRLKPRAAPEPGPVPGCRWIQLTGGRFALVDEADYVDLSQYHWCCSDGYAVRKARIDGRRVTVRMSRQVMCAPPDVLVDHRNGDALDNRRFNLRFATHAQNSQNQRRGGAKGVKKVGSRWSAKITANGVEMYLGTFKTQDEAARAYDLAAAKHHGEFANQNGAPPTREEALHRALQRYQTTRDHGALALAVELFLGASEEEMTT